MRVNAENILEGAVYLESPNQDARPDGVRIDLVVLHAISLPQGVYGEGHIESFFTNTLDLSIDKSFDSLEDLRVSSHLLIGRNGAITQFVAFNARAWHAGVSSFNGRSNCNDFTIGIELEGAADDTFTDIQYANLVATIDALIQKYSAISYSRIVGHNEVAPGRKWDPGSGFDWTRLISLLHSTAAKKRS